MKKLSNPPVFQGSLNKKSYFEGWYIKCLSDDLSTSIAFIPGISLSKDRHAFIQVNTSNDKTEYIRFPLDTFRYEEKVFAVALGNSFFSDRGVHLDLDRPGLSLQGDLTFEEVRPFPSHFMAPGIMGAFTYVPFMECYHGVVSMRHKVQGIISLNDHEYGFENGIGYIEKDWGRSFPESWVWMQANPFQESDASFMLSVAKIPWMGLWFTGLIGFLNVDDQVYRFATYLGDSVSFIEDSKDGIYIHVKGPKYHIRVFAELNGGGGLIAPVNGKMKRKMKESLNSTLHIEFSDKRDKIIFRDTSHIAGLEISGDVKKFGKS